MQLKDLEFFRMELTRMREELLNSEKVSIEEDLHISSEDLSDETDLATGLINQELSFSFKKRDLEKIRQIEFALERIKSGQFGLCEECCEPISLKRLKNRPWTTLCITHAEEQERELARFQKSV